MLARPMTRPREIRMFAIVETGGKQYRVEAGATIVVDRLSAEAGSTISLDRVLMVGGDDVKVGSPVVAGAAVEAEVIEHGRGDKVVTFKYTPRQRTRRRVGFRASNTTLKITEIKA